MKTLSSCILLFVLACTSLYGINYPSSTPANIMTFQVTNGTARYEFDVVNGTIISGFHKGDSGTKFNIVGGAMTESYIILIFNKQDNTRYSVEHWKISGDFCSITGYFGPDGNWVTLNTPYSMPISQVSRDF